MNREIITFKSSYDGSDRGAIILFPSVCNEPMPLVIVPHAANYSAADTSKYWEHIISRRHIFAVFPYGHGREDDMCSLGWKGQISDLAQMPEIVSSLGLNIDTNRIYAVGISMGGQEALLLAGMYPNVISGVVAFNPVVDLTRIYYYGGLSTSIIEYEVGGSPREVPDEYALRSPINLSATLANVPILLYWDPDDNMILGQTEYHCGKLYQLIKKANPDSLIVSRIHKYGHFWINPGQALRWLTTNCKR